MYNNVIMEELERSSRGIHAGLSGNGEDKQRKHMLLIQPAEALNETPSMSRNLAHASNICSVT